MKILEIIKLVEELNDEIFDAGYEDYGLSVYTNGYEFNITLNGLDMCRSIDADSEIPLREALLDKVNESRNMFNDLCGIMEDKL